METATVSEERLHYDLCPVRWGRAVISGLVIGAIFLLFSRGLPWASSGLVSFTVMGRELQSPAVVSPGLDFTIAATHMLCAVIYALIIIPVIHRFHPAAAIWLGAALGIVLYFLSMIFFTQVLNTTVQQHELNPFITHIAFGAIVAGYYKGWTRRRVPLEEPV